MPKLSIFKSPFLYFAAVVIGYGADFSIYALLVEAGVSIYPANIAGFFVGVTINVVLIRAFVFENSRFQIGTDLLLTIVMNGTMLVLGTAFLWLLVELVNMNVYAAKLVSNGVTFVINYLIRLMFFRAE